MTMINSVAILGAGAMGAAYAAMFFDASGFDVRFVADGARYARLRSGVTVNDRHYPIQAVRPEEAGAPADLLLVALKHHHLSAALPLMEKFIGERTIILSVMNGLTSEEIVGERYGLEKLVYAIAVGIDALRDGDHFLFSRPGKIFFGPTAQTAGDRLERLAEALTRAGIANEIPPDIQRTLWWKFMINVGVNQASAVLRAPYGVFQTSAEARALMETLMEEVLALAPKAGVALGRKDIDEWNRVMAGLAPHGKTSMLQDIEAGRKTEVDIFAGTMVELGERFHVPTPVNAAVLHIIRALEERSSTSA
jgi:2-dehydropantoate 2-reductase